MKWSTSNKKVATVNSKGKVTANAKETATITAKVGNKSYKCTVNVTVTDYKKNIKIEYKETPTSVIAIMTNNNNCAVSIEPQMLFYDALGNVQSIGYEYNYCFEPKSTIAICFDSYNSSTYTSQTYASYKINLGTVSKSFYTKYGVSKILAGVEGKNDSSLIVRVQNNSSNKYDTIRISVVYYDNQGNVIGYDDTFADCKSSGSIDYINLYYPLNNNYEYITPANYKIYVNYAYQY